ncbi:ribonuclease H-like domain-containing protein [Tanacetum coccineum]
MCAGGSTLLVLINNLDAGNPLHIQTNDNNGSTLISFKLLVKCACASSSELVLHQQLMKLMQFLMGLDDSYQPIMSALLTRDPLPKVKDAYTTVSREESNRGVPKSFGVFELKINASSFAAKTFNNNRRHSNNNNNNTKGSSSNSNVNRGHNPNLNCKNYGKIGHTINRCYEIVGFPLGFKRNANIGKQSFDANTDVKINGKQSYSSLSFGFTFEQIQKLLSLINGNTSGSIHANMTGRASFFNGRVKTLATISHVGNLKLYNNVILYDVLVVPGYCDWKKDKILRTGSEFGGLYLFDMIKDNCVGKSNMVMCFHVCKLIWHNRLGHPSDQILSVLHNDLDISKSSSSAYLRGPYRVLSTEGFKCVLTVLDDYSRLASSVLKIFPFKMKSKTCDYEDVDSASESYHLSFFDNQMSQSPYDEGRATSIVDGNVPSSRYDTTDTTSSLYQEENTANQFDDQSSSKGNNSDSIFGPAKNVNIFEQEDVQTPKIRRVSPVDEDVYMTLPQGYENVKKVYVDDIVITGNNVKEFDEFKKFLRSKFLIKYLGKLKYFLGIEVLDNDKANQLLGSVCFLERLLFPRNVRKAIISKSSIDAEYRSMASATCETIWLGNLLHSLGVTMLYPVELHCDNNYAIQLAANPVFS